jgi:hypothetical protein
MADFTGAAAGAGLSVGTLTINLAINNSGLTKGLEDANKQLRSMGQIMEAQFKAAGGALGQMGERIGNVSKSIQKMFGDDAPAALQKFGREMSRTIGLSETQLKGLGQSAEAMEGAFKLAGAAVTTLLSPLGAVLAAALGIAAAIGAVKNAFDALKNAGSGGSGGIIDRANDWALQNVPGAQLASDFMAGVGFRANNAWNAAKSEPGSIAETISKMDVAADIKAALGRVAKDLKEYTDPLFKMLSPGTTKAERDKAAKAAQGEWLGFKEGGYKEFLRDQEKFADAQIDFKHSEIKMFEQYQREKQDAWDMELEALKDANEKQRRIDKERNDQLSRQEQETRQRWQALSGGQFGSTLGMMGSDSASVRTAGAGLNIIGQAAAGYELTGTALQGAAQGGEAGGVWGAVIGAILALLTKTEAFNQLMTSIEGILKDLLPVLNEVLQPILRSIDGLASILSPIFGILDKLFEVLNLLNKPLDALNGIIEPLMEMFSQMIDSLDTSKAGMDEIQVSDGKNKMSLMDAMTGTGLLNAIGDEVSKLTSSKTATPEYAAQWRKDYENVWGPGAQERKIYEASMKAAAEAKQREIDETNRTSAALRELTESIQNSVQGYKIAGRVFAASDSVGGMGSTGNPYGGE